MPHSGLGSPKAASPQRPRHRISRSITDVSAPIRLNHKGHHHGHHQHRRRRDDRDADPQSAAAVLQGVPYVDGLVSDGGTPGLSANPSRRASLRIAPGDESGAGAGSQGRHVGSEDTLSREQKNAAMRAEGLNKSLTDLDSFYATTTKRLDAKYHSILVGLNNLDETITALKELAVESQETNEDFKHESNGLVSDFRSQLDSFGEFDDQQKRVEVLQNRIGRGREKINNLSSRLEKVRDTVERWERADRTWQEKTRKRLKFIWIIISIVFSVMMLLLVGAVYAPNSLDRAVEDGLPTTGNSTPPGGLRGNGSDGDPSWDSETFKTGVTLFQSDAGGHAASPTPDERLRALDEL